MSGSVDQTVRVLCVENTTISSSKQSSWPVTSFGGFKFGLDNSHLTGNVKPHDASQIIYIDPEFCWPKPIDNFRLTDTPFDFSSVRSYKLYNSSLQNSNYMFPAVRAVNVPGQCESFRVRCADWIDS
ncbi:hypothetical protein L2E82_41646 [Cichorium intybus]|uniref:Uncharacterized protein n=1 Tax=Cichorium intybus TaxID=13427 RepID=A0ACB8ZKJ7_CICIN|nr:hypothetical protein L2E82_41646 [Cichorium intybus]